MAPKVLVVLTSHDHHNANNNPTGWFLVSFLHNPLIYIDLPNLLTNK